MLRRLLAFWVDNRRMILITLIFATLAKFLWSLPPAVRSSLLHGLLANRLLVGLLLSFNLLVLSLLFSTGQRLDTWIFLRFNLRRYPRWMDRLMWAYTQIGNGLIGLCLGVFLYFSGQRTLSFQLLIGILTLWFLVELVKAIVERGRPYTILKDTRIIGWRERGLSFPSGHTAQAFFMTTVMVGYLNLGLLFSGFLYGLATLVGFTRIYVGAHYPRDVAAGAVLGSVWGILTGLIRIHLGPNVF